MSIPTLKQAATTTIVIHLWRKWELTDILSMFTYPATAKNRRKKELSRYYDNVEEIIKALRKDEKIPEPYKILIGIKLLQFCKEMTGWFDDIAGMLRIARRDNITYCLYKTHISQKGEIDKARTIIMVMFLTSNRIQFDIVSTAMCCNIPGTFEYVSHAEQSNERLFQKVKIIAESMNPFDIWRKYVRDLGGTQSVTSREVLIEAALYAPVDVWEHMVHSIEDDVTQEVFCLALIHIILNKSGVEKIVYITDKIYEELWTPIIYAYWPEVLIMLLTTKYADSSIHYFEKTHTWFNDKLYLSTFQHIATAMNDESLPFHCSRILYASYRNIFMKIWLITPNKVKSRIAEHLHDLFANFSVQGDHTDYRLLSILVTDSAFNEEQKKVFIMKIVFDFVDEVNIDKIDLFLDELPPHINEEYLQNDISRMLKQYIKTNPVALKHGVLTYYAFKERHVMARAFKKEIFADKEFVVQSFASMFKGCDSYQIIAYLKWGFNNDVEAVGQFVMSKLVAEQWLLTAYKQYLLESDAMSTNSEILTTILPFGDRRRFKEQLLSDKVFLHSILDRAMKRGKVDMPSLITCILTKIDYRRTTKFEEHETDSCDSREQLSKIMAARNEDNQYLYQSYKLDETIKDFFKFKSHWCVSENVCNLINETVTSLDQNKSSKKVARPPNKRVLLPHTQSHNYYRCVKGNMKLLTSTLNSMKLSKTKLSSKLSKSISCLGNRCQSFRLDLVNN